MEDDRKKIAIEQFVSLVDILDPCMDDYLYIYDLQNDTYCISPGAVERFLIPGTRFTHVLETLSRLAYPVDLPILMEDLEQIQRNERSFHNLEYRWLTREGKPVWINCRGQVIRDEQGKPEFLIGCINEIGRSQKADNISGLRREAGLFKEISENGQNRLKGFVLRIGIDGFKEINENRGMDYGDMILQKTAECIESVILPEQKLFRIVADEFVVSDFTGRDTEEAKRLYIRICWELNRFIQNNHYEVFYTISAGIVGLDSLASQEYSDVMKLAEFALNKAKELGRNQYYLYQESDYESFRNRRKIIQIIRQSVNHGFDGFEAYFQPIMDIREQRLCGAETLLRFRSEETGRVSPAEFIPLLEDSGLIIPVGIWVLEQAVKACCKIQEVIPDFRISVNLSYVQVLKSDILADLVKMVHEYKLKPGSLMVELTESGFLEDNSRFRCFCEGLKENGILLALDDFGSGYSNFRYLYNLSPSTLKIDRTFTIKAIHNDYEYKLLHYMVEMTHNIDLKLCIEGIETKEELSKICQIEPDYIQGYYFGKPCPFNSFMESHVSATTA
ncbi:MAG: EAL domain-containing protein [Acetatifactor sp.]